jgi:hypothetical protein
MTRSELRNLIKRRLGCPMINVEIADSQLDDAINHARELFIKRAVGNATQEVYFTLLLKAGQWLYDLPTGVTEVISYTDRDSYDGSFGIFEPGGINTLFTFDNYMYQSGMLNPWVTQMYGISYQIAKDFVETIARYRTDRYNYRYHRFTNQLELSPVPGCGNNLTITEPVSGYIKDPDTGTYTCPTSATQYKTYDIDSPGFVLIRAFMIEGSTLPTYTPAITGSNDPDYNSIYDIGQYYNEELFDELWIQNYSLALTKQTLGYIRRKMQNVALGNAGIVLDGESLYSEGKEDAERLEEKLEDEECYEGYGISMG